MHMRCAHALCSGARPAPSLAPGSISRVVDTKGHKGAVEALQHLYVAAHPDRAAREKQPCSFFAIKGGSGGLCKPDCKACRRVADMPPADRPPPYPSDMVAAVKAACTADTAALFKT